MSTQTPVCVCVCVLACVHVCVCITVDFLHACSYCTGMVPTYMYMYTSEMHSIVGASVIEFRHAHSVRTCTYTRQDC